MKKYLSRALGVSSLTPLFIAGSAFAQTATDASTTVNATSPTVPNTGFGGDVVTNVIILAVSLAAAFAGAVYLGLARTRS